MFQGADGCTGAEPAAVAGDGAHGEADEIVEGIREILAADVELIGVGLLDDGVAEGEQNDGGGLDHAVDAAEAGSPASYAENERAEGDAEDGEGEVEAGGHGERPVGEDAGQEIASAYGEIQGPDEKSDGEAVAAGGDGEVEQKRGGGDSQQSDPADGARIHGEFEDAVKAEDEEEAGDDGGQAEGEIGGVEEADGKLGEERKQNVVVGIVGTPDVGPVAADVVEIGAGFIHRDGLMRCAIAAQDGARERKDGDGDPLDLLEARKTAKPEPGAPELSLRAPSSRLCGQSLRLCGSRREESGFMKAGSLLLETADGFEHGSADNFEAHAGDFVERVGVFVPGRIVEVDDVEGGDAEAGTKGM